MGADWYTSLSAFGYTLNDRKSIQKASKKGVLPEGIQVLTVLTEHHSRMEGSYNKEMNDYAYTVVGFNANGMELSEIAENAEKLIVFVKSEEFIARGITVSNEVRCVSGIRWYLSEEEEDEEEEGACELCKLSPDGCKITHSAFASLCKYHRPVGSLYIVAKHALPRMQNIIKSSLESIMESVIHDKLDNFDDICEWHKVLMECSEFIEPEMMLHLTAAENLIIQLIEDETREDD
jgi:hypothetical protein